MSIFSLCYGKFRMMYGMESSADAVFVGGACWTSGHAGVGCSQAAGTVDVADLALIERIIGAASLTLGALNEGADGARVHAS